MADERPGRDEPAEALLARARSLMARDWDIGGGTADAVCDGLRDLLAHCDLVEGEADEATRVLVDEYVTYCAAPSAGVGSSAADACALHCVGATEGLRLAVMDDVPVRSILRGMVRCGALRPEDEVRRMRAVGLEVGAPDARMVLAEVCAARQRRLEQAFGRGMGQRPGVRRRGRQR